MAQTEFLRHALSRKRLVEFLGIALPIVTVEDLILLKTLAGRLQDRADIEKIRLAQQIQVDWPYVERWAQTLGVHVPGP